MKQKSSYKRLCFTKLEEGDQQMQDFFNIFTRTLKPDMDWKMFEKYFASDRLDYIDVTLVLLNGLIVGFCSAAFYKNVVDGRDIVIGRAATGILQQYRGSRLPKWKLYTKYMRYWLKHPFGQFWLTAYIANPLIYAMVCKYTAFSYPKPNVAAPEKIINMKNALLRSQNLHRKEGPAFVVRIHFHVMIGEKDMVRIFESKDRAVTFYLRINPKFNQQRGVLVMIPVNFINILLSTLKFVYHFCARMLKSIKWPAGTSNHFGNNAEVI